MRIKRDRFYSNPGSAVRPVYAPSVAYNGSMELEIVGAENTDEIIQSYAESTDIRVILSRVASGEVELLNQSKGSFGDFTKMPTSLAEVLQLQMDSNKLFNSLPVDVRRKFNDDPNQFFASAGSQQWFEDIAPILPEQMRSINNTPQASASETPSSTDSAESK